MARQQNAFIPCKDTTTISPNVEVGQLIIVKASYDKRNTQIFMKYDPTQRTTTVEKKCGAYKLTVLDGKQLSSM